MITTRLMVRNIPDKIDEQTIKKHFSKFGEVTDVRIVFKGNKNRRFCFIGYKTLQDAQKSKEYYHKTFLQTKKIIIDYALPPGADQQQKPQNEVKQGDLKRQEQTSQIDNELSDLKKQKFQEFLELMKPNKSWNDAIVTKQGKQNSKVQKEKEELIDINQFDKEQKKSKKQKKIEEKKEQIVKTIDQTDSNFDSKRLYITNIPYNTNEEEIKQLFGKFGDITEILLPKNKETGQLKGICFIKYEIPEQAMHAFADLDKQFAFGRILHIQPAREKTQPKYVDNQAEQEIEVENESSYKKKKKIEMRKKLEDQINWNTLFLNPNSILEAISKKHNIQKSDILSEDAANMAVRVAQAETQLINETKQWLEKQGINLDFLSKNKQDCERSETIILVKNLPYSILQEKLQDIFSNFGEIQNTYLSPNRSIGIVEFSDKKNAKIAFEKLSYHPVKHNPLYLEWAPIDLLDGKQVQKEKQLTKQELIVEELQENEKYLKVLYVKNLSYETTEYDLREHFEKTGTIKSVKIVKNHEGNSQGYGFIEFQSEESVQKALKNLQNSLLHEHALKLSQSKKKKQTNQQQTQKQSGPQAPITPKIVIRNLAFEAKKSDIRELFESQATVKSVRIPKKLQGKHRGFAFVEFHNIQEAQNAFEALQSTHLYGRKLVLEWAQNEEI